MISSEDLINQIKEIYQDSKKNNLIEEIFNLFQNYQFVSSIIKINIFLEEEELNSIYYKGDDEFPTALAETDSSNQE